jgi:hypothetical protein
MALMDKHEITFHSTTHRYFCDGQELTSVTTALKSAGVLDYSGIPFDVLEPAQIVGDIVHEIAHYYGKDTLDEESVGAEYRGYLEAIRSFHVERVRRVLYVEQKIASRYYGFAGTFDICYVSTDGKIVLDDYKTAKLFHPGTALQTSAYQYAAERQLNIKIDERGGVALGGDGQYKRVTYNTLENRGDFDRFLCALKIAQWKQTHKLPQ